jgi:DNA polymerase III gamma/tau subunit
LAGQSALTARLTAALERGRVAHAVIFAGPSGSGKRTLAGIYARSLLCGSDSRKPCNACGISHTPLIKTDKNRNGI